jgi:hypothetical protein
MVPFYCQRGPVHTEDLINRILSTIRLVILWLPLRSFEVPQQLGKGLLIHVMRLPAPKVPNVARIANQRWPARL